MDNNRSNETYTHSKSNNNKIYDGDPNLAWKKNRHATRTISSKKKIRYGIVIYLTKKPLGTNLT